MLEDYSIIQIIFQYIAVYLISIILGWIIINPIIRKLAMRYLPKLKWDRTLPRIVGALEQAMYTTSILVELPEFIGVWLIIKLAGEWRQGDRKKSYPMYNIFLIGNSLSLIFSVATAFIIRGFLPAWPY